MQALTRALPACLLLMTSSQILHAAEWKIDPTLRFSAGYDNNVRLSTVNEVSTARATFSPSAVFSVETPTSGINGTMSFDFRRFEADSDLNDDNSQFTVDIHHNRERSRLGLTLSFINDTTLDTQFENTGIVFDRVRRQTITASPSWTYALNALTNLNASYNYSDSKYINASNSAFIGFKVDSAQLSLNRILNERSTASITFSGTRSNNDNNVESTTLNLQGGASYQFNEKWSGSLFGGYRRTEVNSQQGTVIFSGDIAIGFIPRTRDVTSNTQGLTFNASIRRVFQRGSISVSTSRSVTNDINGQPIETTRLNPIIRYRFSQTLSGILNLQFITTKGDDNSLTTSLDQTSYQIAPTLTWNLKKFWSLSASYRYRRQAFDDASDEATQNAADLTLTYRWPRIAASR